LSDRLAGSPPEWAGGRFVGYSIRMQTVLITAFEPYDRWSENASWLALVELTRELPTNPRIVTRRYPVDFDKARARLAEDLAADYDVALHLGQAPGIGRVHLEQIGLNVGGLAQQTPDQFQPLVNDGPAAYRSALPLQRWAADVRETGVPCQVSFHAGTYLCNAVLYLSHYFSEQQKLKTKSAFIHLPLAPQQVLADRQDLASMPSNQCAQAMRTILSAIDRSGGLA
jgi:pyroglutamyl-peptidase